MKNHELEKAKKNNEVSSEPAGLCWRAENREAGE